MRVHFDRLEIMVEAEAAEQYPKIFTKIHVEFRVHGRDIPEDKLQRAIELSRDKYCSIGAQLKASAELVYSHKILHENESRK